MASRCQRSILSCSRCRKRKTKCDRQLPSCSQCVAAKAVCTGISAGKTADVPRSLVQHLELEIARLETELSGRQGRIDALGTAMDMDMDVVHASDILLRMPAGPTRPGVPEQDEEQQRQPDTGDTDVLAGNVSDRVSTSGHVTRESNPTRSLPQDSSRAFRTAILSGKPLRSPFPRQDGMTPSAAQLSDSTKRTTASAPPRPNKGASQNSNMLLRTDNLCSIPVDIIQRLMKKYLSTIQRDSPFLVATTVTQQFQTVIDVLVWQTHAQQQGQENGQPSPVLVPPSNDFLVVYLVLAISVTLGSANSNGHEERYMALSTALFEEGIQHFYSLGTSFPSEIAWLQAILLLLLYATVSPRSANVWVLSGTAMRACLELGLHRELPEDDPSGELDQEDGGETLDLRRRVFWSAYCMDRSICSALQRPLSTPDAAIDTELPAQQPGDDDDTFLASIAYHRLLSEMLHVHFQREPIPQDQSWDDWVGGMESRLRSWHERYGGGSVSDTMPYRSLSHHHEMTEFNMARGLMILHRPSPRRPSPSPRSLLIAFESAAAAARMHSEHIRAGFFRRPWLSAHHTLEAATVVLFCLRHGSEAIAASFSPSRVFDMTKLFTSNLLSITAQGWPEVSVYASVYERLLAPLLERVFLRRADLSDLFGPAQDAELTRLLYPGPAHIEKLRFGWRQQAEELSPFDFNLFMMDDDYEPWGHNDVGQEHFDLSGGGNGQDHADGDGQWDNILALHGVTEPDFTMAIS